MKIASLLKQKSTTISFEIFPPKSDSSQASVISAAEELGRYNPDFISVTYGAAGGTKNTTVDIASYIQNRSSVPALAHLTGLSSTRSEVAAVLESLEAHHIENILALRGDRPGDTGFVSPGEYRYASELIAEIKRKGRFCVGAACYPEGHPESGSRETDLDNLKRKVDAGCDFLTTQMFFDNEMLYSFLYRAQSRGITVPVIAGIMPITNGAQIKRMLSLSNAYLPSKFLTIMDKFGNNNDALRQAGLAYATEQIIDLITNGVRGIHIYTMNKPETAKTLLGNISEIVRACNSVEQKKI
jgi:methylenetetrahydrofolate reductase (NADPH)